MGEPEQPAEGTDTAGTTDKSKGRPRPAETIERDEKVLAYLSDQKDEAGAPVGKTRDEIAGALEMPGKQVYLSLYRLSRGGQIVKGTVGGGHHWSVVTVAEPVPAA